MVLTILMFIISFTLGLIHARTTNKQRKMTADEAAQKLNRGLLAALIIPIAIIDGLFGGSKKK